MIEMRMSYIYMVFGLLRAKALSPRAMLSIAHPLATISKCKDEGEGTVLHVSSCKFITLGNSVLQETKTHTYLGVDITHNLKWNTHMDRITNSANKTLGFVQWNLGSCTKDTKVTAYKALIRPTLEYCSGVWDPHTVDLVKKVGKIAVIIVLNNYD